MTDLTIVELGPEDADDYLELYRGFEWWADRDRANVERALEHTPLAVGLREAGELMAAARTLTDFVYYAKVYDVVVAESRRGEGLGTRLMEAITETAALDSVDVLELRCREGLVPFYEGAGFEVDDVRADVDGHDEAFVTMNYQR